MDPSPNLTSLHVKVNEGKEKVYSHINSIATKQKIKKKQNKKSVSSVIKKYYILLYRY
jgi:hypothetical protein